MSEFNKQETGLGNYNNKDSVLVTWAPYTRYNIIVDLKVLKSTRAKIHALLRRDNLFLIAQK